MHIKHFLFGTALASLALGAAAANSADIMVAAPIAATAPATTTAFNWAGPYAGLELGVNRSKFHAPHFIKGSVNPITDAELADLIGKPKEKILGGLFAGYNIALGQHAIMGIDGNLDLHSVKTSKLLTDTYKSLYKETAMAAARIRLGYATGRLLPYIAGGLTELRASHSALSFERPQPDVPSKAVAQHWFMGWNVGGGVDYALSDKIIVRTDYRFAQTAIQSKTFIGYDQLSLPDFDRKLTLKSHELRLGVAYKF